MIAFGPVPSRRLGRSLGINNIPPKSCTYSCVYCQLGKTRRMLVARRPFYEPADIFKSAATRIERAGKKGESIDYLTFVADGEPTLDANLGREIDGLKTLGIKIAVITNGSLIHHAAVQADLMKADWVSLKIDSTRRTGWRRINRPHQDLELELIIKGMLEFSEIFDGDLTTETMLVRGINDNPDMLRETAQSISKLKIKKAYLSIPKRPPAENWVHPPSPADVNMAFQIFSEKIGQVEYLIGYEGNEFAFTGEAEDDLLSITAVHPMRRDAVDNYLTKAGKDWTIVDELISLGQIIETAYNGQKFYIRNLRTAH
jgi:wyosine [tRNA(Phe)-imidazoG37] synthetase (radical SAM superfamily)